MKYAAAALAALGAGSVSAFSPHGSSKTFLSSSSRLLAGDGSGNPPPFGDWGQPATTVGPSAAAPAPASPSFPWERPPAPAAPPPAPAASTPAPAPAGDPYSNWGQPAVPATVAGQPTAVPPPAPAFAAPPAQASPPAVAYTPPPGSVAPLNGASQANGVAAPMPEQRTDLASSLALSNGAQANVPQLHSTLSFEEIIHAIMEASAPGIQARQAQLEERFNALEQAVQTSFLEKDKKVLNQLTGAPSDTDVLHLNVGGTPMEVLRGTLTAVQGSLLANIFSGKLDAGIKTDPDGRFFIDQPIELFKPLVDCLRSKGSDSPMASPVQLPTFEGDTAKLKNFERMVEYYGMTPSIYPMELAPLGEKLENTEMITGYPEYRVDCTQLTTFRLSPLGHHRKVKAFEVTLGKIKNASFGWIHSEDIEIYAILFVGENGTCNVAIAEHENIEIEGLEVREGTVIRCESDGKWSVDGRVIEQLPELPESFIRSTIPIASINGNLRISSIELK